jgi:hypothetical protein
MAGKIKISGRNLVFEIEGFDKIFAIKRVIKVPLKHITSVSMRGVSWFKPMPYLRMGGTALPGLIMDGRYITSKGWVFYVMHSPRKCIAVNLNHEFYKKIIFEVEDKKEAVLIINKALRLVKK